MNKTVTITLSDKGYAQLLQKVRHQLTLEQMTEKRLEGKDKVACKLAQSELRAILKELSSPHPPKTEETKPYNQDSLHGKLDHIINLLSPPTPLAPHQIDELNQLIEDRIKELEADQQQWIEKGNLTPADDLTSAIENYNILLNNLKGLGTINPFTEQEASNLLSMLEIELEDIDYSIRESNVRNDKPALEALLESRQANTTLTQKIKALYPHL